MRWQFQYHPKSLREGECSPGCLCKQQAERGQGLCWEGTVCDNKKQESREHLLQVLGILRELWTCGGAGAWPEQARISQPPLEECRSAVAPLLGPSPGQLEEGESLCSLNLSWEPCSFIPFKSSMALGKSLNLSTSVSSTFICEMG